jgi:hypothetical protein
MQNSQFLKGVVSLFTPFKKFDSRTLLLAVLIFFLIYFGGLLPSFWYSSENFIIIYIAAFAAYFIPGLILGRRLEHSIFSHAVMLCLIMIATTLLTPWMVSGYLNSKDEVFDSDSILSAGRSLSYYLSIACLVLCLLGTAIGRLSLKHSDNKATTF